MLGHSFSRSGDHDQAVSAYALLARHLAPASLSPRIFLGMEFLKTRQPGLATPYLLEAYNADPGNPWVLNELGLLYSLKKDYARALSSLSSASVLLAQQRARHPHADLLATVLGNLVAVRLKKIASGSTDGAAAMEDVMEAVLSAKEALHLPEDRQSTRMLNACAAAFELAFQLTGDLGCCAQAADLYFRVLQSSPGDKIANEGYKRSLVAKVQAAPIPPLDAEDAMEMDNDCTPANNDHGMDVESSPVSGPASMAAPSSLRRKLTTLSFARLEVGEAEVVLETPRPPGQEGDPDLDFRQHRRRHY
jgi:tetratricopeptide (TPR) repeat protein